MLKDIEFANSLYFDYEKYAEHSLSVRRFKHNHVMQLVGNLNKKIFIINTAGKSIQGRDIIRITAGTGRKRVLCWSQMHGDEATATMALFDIFNFLAQSDNYDPVRKMILTHLTLSFIPMLNPDGAEVFSRRNKAGIDINRDALKLITPEANILTEQADMFKPDFAFNLHDQDIHYTAGTSFKSAAISFLAPPLDKIKTTDHVRLEAMKLISKLYKILFVFIPGHIGKYKEDFEERAFGDNFQKNGASTILIESGGWKDDPEKQFLRKLNFILLLSAFKSIAEESYKQESSTVYEEIPFNEIYLFDVLLKNMTYKCEGKELQVDIGINFEEKTCSDGINFFKISSIADMGDLRIYFGNEEIDLSGYEVCPGKTFNLPVESVEAINPADITSLYKDGFTNLRVNTFPDNKEFSPLPINIVINPAFRDKENIIIDDPANLVIKKEGEIKYLVLNGQIISPDEPAENFGNALIL